MIIYLDSDFRCYLTDDGTRRAIETHHFDGKCKTYIEGYRLVPEGETWTNPRGLVFDGEMISPAVDSVALDKAQEQYEVDLAQMEDMQNALNILGVTE